MTAIFLRIERHQSLSRGAAIVRRQPGSEFPNDNCSLHGGAIWVCLKPTGGPRAVVRPPEPGAPDLDLPPPPSPGVKRYSADGAHDDNRQPARQSSVEQLADEAPMAAPRFSEWVEEPTGHVDAYELPPVAILPAQPIFESERAPCPPPPRLPKPEFRSFDAPSLPELPASVRSALAEFERSLEEPWVDEPPHGAAPLDDGPLEIDATPNVTGVQTPSDWQDSDPFVRELARLVSPLLHQREAREAHETDNPDDVHELAEARAGERAPESPPASATQANFEPLTEVTSLHALTPPTAPATSYAAARRDEATTERAEPGPIGMSAKPDAPASEADLGANETPDLELPDLELPPLELTLTPLSGERLQDHGEQPQSKTERCVASASVQQPCRPLLAAAHAQLTSSAPRMPEITTSAGDAEGTADMTAEAEPRPDEQLEITPRCTDVAPAGVADVAATPNEPFAVAPGPSEPNRDLLVAAHAWFSAAASSAANSAVTAPRQTAELSLVRTRTEPAAAPDQPAPDFQRFIDAVVAIALERGATKAAGCLPLLLEGQSLDAELLSDETWQRLRSARVVDARGAHYAPSAEFLSVAQAWQAALGDPGADLGDCGGTTLDAWSTTLLTTLLGCPEEGQQVRRQLRRRGVAAFGLLQAA